MDSSTIKKESILGIPFACGTLKQLMDLALDGRGLVVAPSAPCLVLAYKDSDYAQQLAASQLAIADSGAMVLIWRLARRKSLLRRVSGLAFLKAILNDSRIRRPGDLFLVDPSPRASLQNREWLRKKGIHIETEDQYIAPIYKPEAVEDHALLERLLVKKPRYVLINLGGGIQERLGAWLQAEWLRRDGPSDLPTIICTGAAIAFLTGEQSHIPTWADRLYLGWAVRCMGRPNPFVGRYLKSTPILYYTLKDATGKKVKEVREEDTLG